MWVPLHLHVDSMLVMKATRGTVSGSLCQFSATSRNTLMRSSMKKLSVQAITMVGISTVSSLTLAATAPFCLVSGVAVLQSSGPWSFVGSHSLHREISFDRSVIILENAHHVDGFRDPPKVSLRLRWMQVMLAKINVNHTAVLAECMIGWHASEQSCLVMQIHVLG